MLNNKSTLLALQRIGLGIDESKVYLTLLKKPMSHLEIARSSGVNRTKVYRIADSLTQRGLITETTTDAGRELSANNPANLEISLTTAEEKLKVQREAYDFTLPTLLELFKDVGTLPDTDFVVNTYEGVGGFKQMLWNELRAEGEVVVLGGGSIQALVDSERWAEKHRAKTIEAGYTMRELLNPSEKSVAFTKNRVYLESVYRQRSISRDIINTSQQVAVYNNTVAIYHWKNDQKVGVEIINKAFADMQRSMFEHYWQLADQTTAA